MKKFLALIILSLILGSSVASSNESIKKDGFLIPTNKWKDKIKINENFQVNNPKDKIIIIYNHGSSVNDVKSKNYRKKDYVPKDGYKRNSTGSLIRRHATKEQKKLKVKIIYATI